MPLPKVSVSALTVNTAQEKHTDFELWFHKLKQINFSVVTRDAVCLVSP